MIKSIELTSFADIGHTGRATSKSGLRPVSYADFFMPVCRYDACYGQDERPIYLNKARRLLPVVESCPPSHRRAIINKAKGGHMAKINHALYRGIPVRHVALSKRQQLWFFETDVLSSLGLDADAVMQIPDSWRGEINVKLAGRKTRVGVLSLYGIFSLCGRAEPRRAADFVHFLYRNGLGGGK